MSWASIRTTSRIEDTASCLMGLFSVNMPLIYGERMDASTRLQLEIIKHSDDESIFAWAGEPNIGSSRANKYQPRGSLLASHPRLFESSREIYRIDRVSGKPYAMTNKGLRLGADAAIIGYGVDKFYVILINCAHGKFIRLDNEYRMKGVTPCLLVLQRLNHNMFGRSRYELDLETHHDGAWLSNPFSDEVLSR
ncbi:hypothetical protein DOTSEDRAFT_70050 [Dothistroma septosporum NZE10]|uniref:Uncharacterized protein n=1 Tax=Dothistroma septosporum (strain NZE10 / CBS 128990) TaxID=675120 RepID=N1PTZ0_DOTSN|nr:hypothetical protein DOTSEDRAFT_70050 [Dothistroma septosporum NZE10]